ncbi:MAG: alpha/beta hydrolase [Propionibacteriales bacterium]|nr:alpha/beta hydrolase [Propionibacteriales bacterium]
MRQSIEESARLPNGITLAYDTFGDRGRPALLLVMGLSGPLNWWSPDLCRMLAERGFFVIRFDNRDVGKSTRLHGSGGTRRDVVRGLVRRKVPPPYTISDMARDAVGLLDRLGIEQAHVTGVSMGGMIAQTLAIEHPHRVLSLVSIMSTTGRRSVGWQDPRLLPMLLGGGARSREQTIARSARTWATIGSPGYPTPADEIQRRAGETYDRGISAAGVARQMQAVLAQPDRTRQLRALTLPTLVIHGLEDRLVHVSGGRATAKAIPDAELLVIPGMGHDLPRALWPTFADGIVRTASRASVSFVDSSPE